MPLKSRQCECQCGKSFLVTFGNRRRKFAPDCPNAEARANETRLRNQDRQQQKRAAHRSKIRDAKRARKTGRKREKICRECGNLSERRPPEGCPRCELPFGKERRAEPETQRCSFAETTMPSFRH